MMVGSDQFYVSKDGDILDQIIFNRYGNTSNGQVEVVLAINRGLAALGPIFEAGVRIRLPDLVDAPPTETISLWD